MRSHRAAPCKHHHTWGFLFFFLINALLFGGVMWADRWLFCIERYLCFKPCGSHTPVLCHAHNYCINTYAKIHCSLFAGAAPPPPSTQHPSPARHIHRPPDRPPAANARPVASVACTPARPSPASRRLVLPHLSPDRLQCLPHGIPAFR